MTAVERNGGVVAGAPATGSKGGPSRSKKGEILREFEQDLKEIKIELSGPSATYPYLAEALFDAVYVAVSKIADARYLKLEDCDEEPGDVTYASGIGFKWTRITWCLGIVKGYHVIADAVTGFNDNEGRAVLKSIELIKGGPNERELSE